MFATPTLAGCSYLLDPNFNLVVEDLVRTLVGVFARS